MMKRSLSDSPLKKDNKYMKYENTSIFREKPQDFSPIVSVAACYIESKGKLLFLKRAKQKPEGGKWGVPGGKIETGESTKEAAVRETFEETGIQIREEKLEFIKTVFIRKPTVDYTYHMYYLSLDLFPKVCLNSEHQEYQWLSLEEASNLSLMSGGAELLHIITSLIK